jgi:GT2 family glycosyltransferase
VAYASGPALTRCLESLATEEAEEVIVVDNGESGPEIAAAEKLDFVTVLSPGSNLGFASGCNFGARRARGEVLVFLNPDTVVARGAIAELARTLGDRTIGIVMPRLRLLDQPALLNSGGNEVHISGLAWAGRYGERAETIADLRDVPSPSGAAMAIRTELFREVGGFTGEFFMYQEDLDLGWRVRLRGLRIMITPAADVYHDYSYDRHAQKHYLLERNRLVFVLTSYSGRLLLLVAPVLVSAEVALLALSLKEGWAKDKLAGWAWCVRNLGWLVRQRRKTQALRRVRDRDLADLFSPVIDPGMLPVAGAVKAVNPLVARYWSLVRRAL